MNKDEFQRLFDQLDALSIGFGSTFREFQIPNNNYPPYNIVKISDDEFNIELALAGFKKNELQMEEHQGRLTIKGNKEVINGSDYQHRGIAARSFSREFRIAEYFEVRSAKLEDGILTIGFVKNVPDEAKPKLIAIK